MTRISDILGTMASRDLSLHASREVTGAQGLLSGDMEETRPYSDTASGAKSSPGAHRSEDDARLRQELRDERYERFFQNMNDNMHHLSVRLDTVLTAREEQRDDAERARLELRSEFQEALERGRERAGTSRDGDQQPRSSYRDECPPVSHNRDNDGCPPSTGSQEDDDVAPLFPFPARSQRASSVPGRSSTPRELIGVRRMSDQHTDLRSQSADSRPNRNLNNPAPQQLGAPPAYVPPVPQQPAYVPQVPPQSGYVPPYGQQPAYVPPVPQQPAYAPPVPQRPAYVPPAPQPPAYIPPAPQVPVRDLLAGWRQCFGKERSEDLELFLHRYESYARSLNAPDHVMIARLMCILEGRAAVVSRKLQLTMTWDQAKNIMREEWEPPARIRGLRGQFNKRARKPRESAEDYLFGLQKIADQAFVTYSDGNREDRVLERFLEGQPDHVLASIHCIDVRNVEDALSAVHKAEAYRKGHGKTASVRQVEVDLTGTSDAPEDSDSEPAPATASVQETEPDEEAVLPTDVVTWIQYALETVPDDSDGNIGEDDLFRVLKATVTQVDKKRDPAKCFFCGKSGHFWTKCFKLRDILEKNGMQPRDRTPKSRKDGKPQTGKPQTKAKPSN